MFSTRRRVSRSTGWSMRSRVGGLPEGESAGEIQDLHIAHDTLYDVHRATPAPLTLNERRCYPAGSPIVGLPTTSSARFVVKTLLLITAPKIRVHIKARATATAPTTATRLRFMMGNLVEWVEPERPNH